MFACCQKYIASKSTAFKLFVVLLSLIILTRLIGILYVPIVDPSEARYAEIARKMVETGNWVTLLYNYDFPFWAKPPLSTWVSALGMSLFGINAFGARILVLVLSLILSFFVMSVAFTQNSKKYAAVSVLILFSCCLFYVASAAVMTDMALTFGTTLSMVAFWQSLSLNKDRWWKYLFFVGLALSLLGKGPVGLILTGAPIFLWTILTANYKKVWHHFPWIKGTILMLAIAGPWYILAELRTPGFLDYFLIGENFKRFFVKGWAGDLYGNAHYKPLGTIWVYWLLAACPWSLWFIALAVFQRKSIKKIITEDQKSWLFYLALWAFCPIVFFTFARNIIGTYPLPGIPAFALLMGYFLTPLVFGKNAWINRLFVASCLLLPVCMIAGILYLQLSPTLLKHQKDLITSFAQEHEGKKLFFYCSNCHSAEFYSGGKCILVRKQDRLQEIVEKDKGAFIAVREENRIPADLLPYLVKEKEFSNAVLFRIKELKEKD